jgi:addiction module HigA family antidote
MKMHNPPHPGEILKTLCLEPLNLTVTDTALSLGISRKTLSAILNGRAGISPEMAVRRSIAFNTSSESWLNQQLSTICGTPSEAENGCACQGSPPPDRLSEWPIPAHHTRPRYEMAFHGRCTLSE